MSSILVAAGGTDLDSQQCISRAGEIQKLGSRMSACAEQADAVLAKLAQLQLEQWESPAGRAYRTTLALQAASLRRGRDALREAAAATLRHARNVALKPLPGF
ncbi:hypothetical protein [Arthrobacter bambusae]|uniref:hypothetical protein n=1 Tax=Arthrobacter bambusae TaxID=1338426 RepID=UPI0027881A2F|nr:hypothetical protein [Arthrobacter bambusae]MDQ0029997.1 hypothetical protein [Arthrobacter bambusae]MDQ0097485.1 hypothetical protein [Arthrobacter bambusae]